MEQETKDTEEKLTPTVRTKIRRLPQRGVYEREAIHMILDEGFICHVGFVADGQPYVIPTAYGRVGETLYIHGSQASRMLRTLRREGVEVCVTVTLIDGLVLARSAFHHSLNYRSVIVFGHATVVADEDEKMEALHAFTEHVIEGRWAQVRPPNREEMDKTLVLSLPLTEASAKVRAGGPVDDEEDYAMPVWAGELPLRLVAQEAVADARLLPEIKLPENVRSYSRSNGSVERTA